MTAMLFPFVLIALKGFQIFDQRPFVFIRQIRAKIVAFVLDEVGTFVCREQLRNRFR